MLEKKKLIVASMRFLDPEQGCLIGYGGREDDIITQAPKVVLYGDEDAVVNLFNPDDVTPVLSRSKFYEQKVTPYSQSEPLQLGVCYLIESHDPSFDRLPESCTLDQIEQAMLDSSTFFWDREALVDQKIHELDETYSYDNENKNYTGQQMKLLALRYEDRTKKEQFESLVERFVKEAKQKTKRK